MRYSGLRDWVIINAKTIADVLTFARLTLALLIIVCALFAEPSILPLVVALTLIAWTTDVLDGNMARRDPRGRRTWIGDNDFAVDMILIYSGLLYFITAGFLPFWPFFAYGIIAAAAAIIWTRQSVMMAFAAPMAAVPIIFSFLNSPMWGWVFIGWIISALTLDWSRFKDVVGDFIRDVEDN
jgi:phosphatidylglycerophosphate synthase